MTTRPNLVLLGTSGGGVPRPHRHGPSWLLQVGEDNILVDCGPGASQQLVRAGLQLDRVGPVLITHHHYDHTADLAYFALASWVAGRARPLDVFGPTPTARTMDLLVGVDGAFAPDIDARLGEASQRIYLSRHGRRHERLSYRAHDIGPGPVLSGVDWSATAATVPHRQPALDSLAYRIDTPAGAVVFSGDARPSAEMVALATGASTLVHECTFSDESAERLGVKDHHTWPTALAELATLAKVRRVVLVHFAPEHDDPEEAERLAGVVRSRFEGEVIAGADLASIPL